jgi:hypothetical protein
MEKFLRSINWLMVGVYGLLMGGVTMLLLYFAVEWDMNPALFFFGNFATMGAIALGFNAMGYGRGWRWLAVAEWVFAAFFMILWVMVEHYMHPALGFSALFFFAAAGVMFFAQQVRQRRERNAEIEFQPLGTLNSGEQRVDALTPSQRDRAPINKR